MDEVKILALVTQLAANKLLLLGAMTYLLAPFILFYFQFTMSWKALNNNTKALKDLEGLIIKVLVENKETIGLRR